MSHIRIDNQKAMKKWSPVLENMGVSGEKLEWMAEYAEFHSINENAYVNAANVAGMGAVLNPVLGGPAGTTRTCGSGYDPYVYSNHHNAQGPQNHAIHYSRQQERN